MTNSFKESIELGVITVYSICAIAGILIGYWRYKRGCLIDLTLDDDRIWWRL